MDYIIKLVLEHLEDPFGHVEKVLLKVLLLLIRTVKQAWHQDKEELTFLGY